MKIIFFNICSQLNYFLSRSVTLRKNIYHKGFLYEISVQCTENTNVKDSVSVIIVLYDICLVNRPMTFRP